MSYSAPSQPTYIIPPPASPNWRTPLLIGVIILLIASNVYLFTQIEHVKTDSKHQMDQLSLNLNNSIDKMRIESSASVQHSRKSVETLELALAQERRSAERAVGQAKVDAQRRVETLQEKVGAEQAKQQKAIDDAKASADTANTKIADVSTDVGAVKTDVQTTKSELEQTVASLKRVSGDVDSHSSLIATNGKELSALRALGERNYSEFNITKGKTATRVSDITVVLRKVDVKRNRFTIQITADDKVVEKKDRTINEPIQFYTSKAKQPYEIVVNAVTKESISGYLATPKVMTSRN